MNTPSASRRNLTVYAEINRKLTAELAEAVAAFNEARALSMKHRNPFRDAKLNQAREALKATKARVKAEAMGCYMQIFEDAGVWG